MKSYHRHNTHQLLAKSTKTPDNPLPWQTLPGHTQMVVEAAGSLLAVIEKNGLLKELPWREKSYQLLILMAAALHDLGKATNLFQGMLIGDEKLRHKNHPVRHEVLSALLIVHLDTPIMTWCNKVFGGMRNNFLWMLSWIVGGHHLKLHEDPSFARKETDRLVRVQGIPREFVFWGSHPDIAKLLEVTKKIGGFETEVPELADISLPVQEEDDLDSQNLQTLVSDYVDFSDAQAKQLSSEDKVCLAIAKALLVAADVAGSALPAEYLDPTSWIEQSLSKDLNSSELEKIIIDKLQGKSLRSFQEQVGNSQSPVTLTIAGCGNGKTLAAYVWARQRAPGKKLFFCYPTTGTASAGFEDYLLAQSSLERTLIHGRAQVDLERMAGTDEDDAWEENQRLESLKAWGQQAIACTVDTVLGLVQNQRRSLFSFPAIAGGAVVLDEIHNYDVKLFGAMLRFLQAFPRVPVLLMTASLPQSRLRLLEKVLEERLGPIVLGEQELENLERYKLQWRQGPEDCWPEVEHALQNQGKVLWVCNKVADAVDIYNDALTKSLPVLPILYHSRFRYRDRVEIQEKVIKEFKPEGPDHPVLVISTQVCEMSLDISAVLLVTALAPFPSLIQRLGRLNRYATEGTPFGQSLIYDFTCIEKRPYSKKDLARSKNALIALFNKPLSQRDLSQVLEEIQQDEEIKDSSAWLDGVWQSYQRPLREGDASITVLLKEDLPEIRCFLKERKFKPNSSNVAAWTIPMYFHSQFKVSDRFGGYPVAGADVIEYDPERGAKWRKQSWQII